MHSIMRSIFAFWIIGILVLLPIAGEADTQSFSAAADAYMQSGSPNANNSSGAVMDLTDTRDGVVRFDISSIPSGSTITSATLTLVATAVGSAASVKNYGAHRILADWTEGTVTWNTPGSTSGTHYASSATQTVAVSTTGSYSWNVASDVASFVSGSATNYGWRIIWSSNTSGTNKQVSFGTKENVTSGNRPVLSVTYTPPDTTAPSAVSDLALSGATPSSINVSWTSPGDDNASGTAASYDLRYSTSTITSGNFSSATQVTGEPTPSVAGSSESMTVSGLSVSTTYYFAIKTSDEVPNTSSISNVPSLATTATPDTTAPSAVSDLVLSGPSNNAMTVSWTSPGDDNSTGTATSYDLRYSTSAITSGNFSSATAVTGEPTPSVAGSSESMNVSGLSPSTTYFFAIKTSDEVPNTSSISNVPSLATTATPDTTAPSAVSDLVLSGPSNNAMTVSWTSPGDDNSTGTATSYDLRYSTSAITSGNFSSATTVTGEPTPSVAGSSESMTVSGLSASTTYFFAIKTSDAAPNQSDISNVASVATLDSGSSSSPSPESSPSSERPSGTTPQRRVIFSGQAYPGSTIDVLQKTTLDALYFIPVPAESKTISDDGSFTISYIGLIGTDYFFALSVKDKDGRSAGILAFSISPPQEENLFEVKDIVVPPTIGLEKSVIGKNDILKMTGYASPNNSVELEIDGSKYKEVAVSQSGLWNIDVDTTYLASGDHRVRVRQVAQDGKKTSNFSPMRTFKLSQFPTPKADLNSDGIVNISDWSIFLFRWGSDKEELKSQNDLNHDGKIDIFDFSIFLNTMKI